MQPIRNTTIAANCLEYMRTLDDGCVDLVFGSPPYEDARRYSELGFRMVGQVWVDWMLELWREMQRISRGLVAMVVEGRTRGYRYSATPHLLVADLHRAGFNLRKDCYFVRDGIPGSGGPDWLKNRCEPIVCTSRPGRLPWSNNVACGHPPKAPPGGAMTHQMQNGRKVAKKHTKTMPDGTKIVQGYNPPKISNPGNVIECDVGGGRMGHRLAHKNEAPFPEKLAEFFVKSFCPPGGLVYDPFCGSGTTAAVAFKTGRDYVTTDERSSQIEIADERLAEVKGAFN